MAVSKEAQSNSRYRQALIEKLVAFCSTPEIGGSSAWVRQTASNWFGCMFVNDSGDEGTVKITVSFPKGSRDGEPYDYDAEADEYSAKLERQAKQKEKAEALKQKKIEADKKRRETMEKAKAKREESGE